MIEENTTLIIGLLIAFGTGAITFLSPCVFPMFPVYLSYITGINVKELQGNQSFKLRRQLIKHALVFLLAISVVFIGLGAGASFLGQWIQTVIRGDTGLLIQRFAGIFIVVMGFFVLGWISIPTLMKERRFQYSKKSFSYIGTFFVGLGFAAGWTPCIGPIFASILLLSASQPAQGILYTVAYVIGFAVPFLVLMFFVGSTKWIVRYSGIIMKIGGVIMIIVGCVMFFGWMTHISEFLLDLVEDTWLSRLG